MKKIYTMTLAACGAIAMTACNDFLDTTPKGMVIPTTVADFKGILIDSPWASTGYPLANLCSDDVFYFQPTANNTNTNAYLWLDNFYKDSESDNAWNDSYEAIYNMNVVIDNIMDATEGTENEKQALMAEAKVQRAYLFWYLQSLYAKAYDPTTAASDLGIPLPLKPDLEALLSRSTVEEGITQILKDLEGAENMLPEVAANDYRPTKASVHGLRARVYFYMGRYDEASVEAEKALSYNSELCDMRTWTFIDEGFPILGVINMPDDNTESPEKIWHRATSFDMMIQMFCISDDLQALYGDKKDLRFKFWFSDIANNGKPWEDGHERYLQDLNYNISVPEMMLIRAEALARHNDDTALDIINTLRTYRFMDEDYRPLTTADGPNLLSIVLDERRRELALSGLRWLDMKRLCHEGLYTQTLEREFEGTVYRLEPNSTHYVVPISGQVIAMNPNIEQNPR